MYMGQFFRATARIQRLIYTVSHENVPFCVRLHNSVPTARQLVLVNTGWIPTTDECVAAAEFAHARSENRTKNECISHAVKYCFVELYFLELNMPSSEGKIPIKNLQKCKRSSIWRLIKEFPSKNRKRRSLDHFLRNNRFDRTHFSGSSLLRSYRTADNIIAVTSLWRAMWRSYDVTKPLSKYIVEYSSLFPLVQTA